MSICQLNMESDGDEEFVSLRRFVESLKLVANGGRMANVLVKEELREVVST